MSSARAVAQAKRTAALEALKAKRNGLNAPAPKVSAHQRTVTRTTPVRVVLTDQLYSLRLLTLSAR